MNNEDDTEHLAKWQDRLQDAIDGELKPELRAHLDTCASCRTQYAKLHALHAQLKTKFANAQGLSADFSARVFAKIDSQEHARRAAAKQRAEQEFRKRASAFKLDWREILQRQLGNVVASLALLAALVAGLSSLWNSVREQMHVSISSLPFAASPMALPIAIFVGAATISVATLWLLRTKAR